MKSKVIQTFGILFVLAALVSCSAPESEDPHAGHDHADHADAVETGPDPTVVDADHYTVELENERVRLVRIKYGPGEESVMHYHPDSLGIFLTDQHTSMQLPDGSTEELHFKAGEHIYLEASQHLPKNIGEEPMELLLVELKAGGAPAPADAGPDPTVVDAGHYTVELENEHVRLVRIAYGPGEESVMHHHPDSVGVFLTDHHTLMQFPDGSTKEIHGSAGDPIFDSASEHLPKNIGEEALELLLVELK